MKSVSVKFSSEELSALKKYECALCSQSCNFIDDCGGIDKKGCSKRNRIARAISCLEEEDLLKTTKNK